MASRVLQKGVNKITQNFSSKHKGIDLGRPHLTEPVIAHTTGTVISVATGHKNNKGSTGTDSYGNYVKIEHGDGYATLYAHLASVKVKKGDKVQQGQVIGIMGNTGNSYGTHLHFEVRKNDSRIDPEPYLNADLPISEVAPDAIYKVYTNRWYSEVTNCNDENSNGYAGVKGKAITAIMAKSTKGVLRYRVHLLKENRWLPWVDNYKDYAGNKGKVIDGIQIDLIGADNYEVKYRVSPTATNGYYDWCRGSSATNPKGDEYAGIFGKAIDCIQIKIEKK